jgi:hypothetical protein
LHKHIFLIRVWCEFEDLEQSTSTLRGVIQHIPSGKKSHLTNLNTIQDFMTPYLATNADIPIAKSGVSGLLDP